jgi:P pilus assembly chaperone PapD
MISAYENLARARKVRTPTPGHANSQTVLNGAKGLATQGMVVLPGSAKSFNATGCSPHVASAMATPCTR